MRPVSNLRTILTCRLLVRGGQILALLLVMLIALMFIAPARNIILYPVWPLAWRDIATVDILIMENSQAPSDVLPISGCKTMFRLPSGWQKDSVLKEMKTYWKVRESRWQLLEASHALFLPAQTLEEKRVSLNLYLVMSEALNEAGVEFFLSAGSLLGAHRHQGIIPWDDDIDLAVNVSHWRTVRDLLSCLEEYHLHVYSRMHWQFSRRISPYPFIDLFFYTENDKYVWALTDYTRRTFALLKEDVFPLTTGQFEGLTVPTPRHTDRILRRQYDFDVCQSRSSNHRTGEYYGDVMVTIPCSSLLYMYDMYHI